MPRTLRADRTARININPVEGLQLFAVVGSIPFFSGQNQHQPSRGITTVLRSLASCPLSSQNQHQPSRGITTLPLAVSMRGDVPESTSTQSRDYNLPTSWSWRKSNRARININPVEGLQHLLCIHRVSVARARININPVEGLQPPFMA